MKTVLLATFVTLALLVGHVNAATISFSYFGQLQTDADEGIISFTLNEPAMVTLRTLSYDGGTNAAGDTVADGGFDPFITLSGVSGNFIAYNDDGGGFDSFLSIFLDVGNYMVIVRQYLPDGGPSCITEESEFVDIHCNQRTGNWALDVVAVPEPTSLALIVLGLVGFDFTRRRISA